MTSSAGAGTDSRACALCGAVEIRDVVVQPEFRIVRCAQCSVARTLPEEYITLADYDESPSCATGYAQREAEGRKYSRVFIRQFEKLQPRGRLLDIGCSIGLLVDEAKRAGYEASGLDLDANAIEYGRAQGHDIHAVAFQDWDAGKYDVITLQHTLEHIPEPVPFLQACAARLNDNGIVAIAVPCYIGLVPRLIGSKWYGWMPRQHYYHYSPKSLRLLLEKAGFHPERVAVNSMDHRPRTEFVQSKLHLMKMVAVYGAAAAGTILNQGDQLFGIGRIQPVG